MHKFSTLNRGQAEFVRLPVPQFITTINIKEINLFNFVIFGMGSRPVDIDLSWYFLTPNHRGIKTYLSYEPERWYQQAPTSRYISDIWY